MAGSRYAYTRTFELPDPLLPTTFFVIRLDGKGFHGFSKAHDFAKPNDVKALELMNMAAKRTMEGKELMGECVIGFGESDEYRSAFEMQHRLGRADELPASLQLYFQEKLQAARPETEVCRAVRAGAGSR